MTRNRSWKVAFREKLEKKTLNSMFFLSLMGSEYDNILHKSLETLFNLTSLTDVHFKI
ncbi:MAG: hypothetical protein RBG13Loki_2348 [Promethearchaeota archaeon CR_4]|nr:MAG: hypothetical protein RBG13Loki_2348 [Candidatus Lokiarchaeota archaeon CR_4]